LELAAAIESQLASLDRGLVLGGVATLNETLSAELSQPRFRAALFGGFAILALLLAAVGLYGVMTQMVAQRRREVAIRMAVGASRGQVLNRIFRETFILAAIGIFLGLVGSAIAAHAMASLLYEVRPVNAGILALSSAVLLLTAFLASWNPARSAAKLDPMQTLRSE
jgi:ABC-type antimicrobial peptide transport system permease subunit